MIVTSGDKIGRLCSLHVSHPGNSVTFQDGAVQSVSVRRPVKSMFSLNNEGSLQPILSN